MIRLIKRLIDGRAKAPAGTRRSAHWPKIRAAHLLKEPRCQVCGGSQTLEVHHVMPFDKSPELELDPENLITLCESGKGGLVCHLAVGHLGNYRSYNPQVRLDSKLWAKKLKERP